LHFDDELLGLLAEESEEESELSQMRHKAMQQCIQKLPEPKRKMLVTAYQPDVSMKDLAARMGKSSAAVYKTVSRLRVTLFDCIHKEISQTGETYE